MNDSIAAADEDFLSSTDVPSLNDIFDFKGVVVFEVRIVEVEKLHKFFKNNDEVHVDGIDCDFDGFFIKSMWKQPTNLFINFLTVQISKYLITSQLVVSQ